MPPIPEIKPNQSIELLKALHILTRDGKLNQDSRRKLKQVYHLFHFIEPLLEEVLTRTKNLTLADHGAGKSYLGFILYDLFLKSREVGQLYGIETRTELIEKSQALAAQLKFSRMTFLNLSVEESIRSTQLPQQIDVVTALHACNTATDDAIKFALHKHAKFIVLVPCCQAEVATLLNKNKNQSLSKTALSEIWRHPIHTREFGSHLTNVLRCLQLESHGYQVTVTELVGWEHSMKNELIIASRKDETGANSFGENYTGENPTAENSFAKKARQRLEFILQELNLEALRERFIY